MAQGKLKKSKLSTNVPKKQKPKNNAAFTRRSNAPIQAKKIKFNENQKIKHAITKSVNKNFESELRSRASEGLLNLSKAQKAVTKHHQQQEQKTTTNTENS